MSAVEETGFELSAQQQRLERRDPRAIERTAWMIVECSIPIDPAELEQAALRLARRHELLRTYYRRIDALGRVLQLISDDQAIEFRAIDASHAEMKELLRAPAKGLRVLVTPNRSLGVAVPAISADAPALREILRALIAEYREPSREPAPQYVDFVGWQNNTVSEAIAAPAPRLRMTRALAPEASAALSRVSIPREALFPAILAVLCRARGASLQVLVDERDDRWRGLLGPMAMPQAFEAPPRAITLREACARPARSPIGGETSFLLELRAPETEARVGAASFHELESEALDEPCRTRVTIAGDTIEAWHHEGEAWLARDLLDALELILERIEALLDAPVEQLPVIGAKERDRLLIEWNRTRADDPLDRSVDRLFEDRAKHAPHALALITARERVTYAQLDARADAWSATLGSARVTGIFQERSVEMVAAVLGVWKAGGAFVAIDPQHPRERIARVLERAGARTVITSAELAARLPASGLRVLLEPGPGEVAPPRRASSADALAYVVFTSGSTGEPKGILTAHRGVTNYLLDLVRRYELGPHTRVLQIPPLGFDSSIRDLFGTLIAGGSVVLTGDRDTRDPAAIIARIREHEVNTLLSIVPSMLREVSATAAQSSLVCPNVQLVVASGERLHASDVEGAQKSFGPGVRVYNQYGPTECTMTSTVHAAHARAEATVPIGGPISNVACWVLDDQLRPVATGATGEVYISGPGLALGYAGESALTALSFLPHPFAGSLPGVPAGARIYRTGDLGRYRGDGKLELAGRADHQVKIRGQRVEPGEIEAVLRRHPGVREAVVVAVPGEGELAEPRLIARVAPVVPVVRASRRRIRLPNGLEIAHHYRSETEHLYEEIFRERVYLRHGIELRDGDTVFDAGANIGLFTMFVERECSPSRIFAFEPAPELFEALSANASEHAPNAVLFPCGLSNVRREAAFTFYPKSPGMSSFFADEAEEREVLRALVANESSRDPTTQQILEPYAAELIRERLESRAMQRPLRSLAEVIEEHRVERIDLLKIDAQKAELAILSGIAPDQWDRIGQIVLEVHDHQQRRERIVAMLEERGFLVTYEQDALLRGTVLWYIYARRPSARARTAVRRIDRPERRRPLEVAELRRFLRERLPEVMLPSELIIGDIPRLPNGKIDRRAAAERSEVTPALATPARPPRTPVEELLLEMWRELLGVHEIGIDDDFFDLGGHSLLAARAVARASSTFGVQLPLARVFETPTIAGIAQAIARAQAIRDQDRAPLSPIPRTGRLPVSHEQQSLYFLELLQPGNATYVVPYALRVRGALELDELRRAFTEVQRRQESMRTRFLLVDGELGAVIDPPSPASLAVHELSGQSLAEARELAEEDAARGFDLSVGPPWRASVFRLAEDDHVLAIVFHHLVFDGWSAGLLFEEILASYRAPDGVRAELPIQYVDYAAWQRRVLDRERLAKHLAFWRARLEGANDTLQISRSSPQHDAPGASSPIVLPELLSARLRELSRREGVTLFMVLLAGLSTVLSWRSGARDLLIGTTVANRNHPDLEPIIGFFVNLLVLRIELSGNPGFSQLLQRVRATTLEAYAHQELPFQKLVELLKPPHRPGRSPYVEVVCALQNAPLPEVELGGMRVEPLVLHKPAKYDLVLNFWETAGGVRGALEYSAQRFSETDIAELIDELQLVLFRAATEPNAPVETFYEELQRAADARAKQRASALAAERDSRFSSARRRRVDRPAFEISDGLPAVARAPGPGVELRAWLENHRPELDALLAKNGAVLFRGFAVHDAEAFAALIESASEPPMPYLERTSPRDHLGRGIYTSTEYPADQSIFPHNESSYADTFPGKIFFFCERAPDQGGETPLCDVRKVYAAVAENIRGELERRNYRLVRNYGGRLGMSWRTAFQTEKREQVESYLRAHEIAWEWSAGERLRTWQVRPVIARHPRTGERCWFNHLAFFHLTTLSPLIREQLLSTGAEPPFQTYFGDGEELPPALVEAVRSAYLQNLTSFSWMRGDVLIIDNLLCAHARNPFAGARRILVGMTEPIRRQELR